MKKNYETYKLHINLQPYLILNANEMTKKSDINQQKVIQKEPEVNHYILKYMKKYAIFKVGEE